MAEPCLDFQRYCLYWFGDLSPSETESVEQHVFSCDVCAHRAEAWGVQMEALEKGFGPLPPPHMSREQVERLGSSAVLVPMPRAPEHYLDLVPGAVHVFAVELDESTRADLERIDVEYLKEGFADPVFEVANVPVPPGGEPIHLACHGHVLTSHGGSTMRVIGTKRSDGTQRGERFTVYEAFVRFA